MPTTTLGTVIKVGNILDLFTEERAEWGVREVSDQLDMPKSTSHALLSSLASTGLLRRTERGRYQLGWRLLSLSHVLTATTRLCTEARVWLQDLSTEYGETVHLATLEAGRVVYIDKQSGARALPVKMTGIGTALPAHCSGVGKVLLAAQPWDSVVTLVSRLGLQVFTRNTIATLSELEDELTRVRNDGCAFDIEEVATDLCCVAGPVRDASGRVVAAVSVSVPTYRFRAARESYRRTVLEAAQGISVNLGYERSI